VSLRYVNLISAACRRLRAAITTSPRRAGVYGPQPFAPGGCIRRGREGHVTNAVALTGRHRLPLSGALNGCQLYTRLRRTQLLRHATAVATPNGAESREYPMSASATVPQHTNFDLERAKDGMG
jgi:hypothetical protein